MFKLFIKLLIDNLDNIPIYNSKVTCHHMTDHLFYDNIMHEVKR